MGDLIRHLWTSDSSSVKWEQELLRRLPPSCLPFPLLKAPGACSPGLLPRPNFLRAGGVQWDVGWGAAPPRGKYREGSVIPGGLTRATLLLVPDGASGNLQLPWADPGAPLREAFPSCFSYPVEQPERILLRRSSLWSAFSQPCFSIFNRLLSLLSRRNPFGIYTVLYSLHSTLTHITRP